ncbi:TniB family NTP-binding protein [Pacificispira sp.]|uniref:TniB family NTP-binding protein n=1 Tax=Pacificispira sp. TaxID=2888761 RepID=UPI003BAA44A7
MSNRTRPLAGNLSDYDISNLTKLRELYVAYDQVNVALNEISDFHAMTRSSSRGGCMTLVGDSGSGKTTIVKSYYDAIRAANRNVQDEMPALLVTLPEKCSIKELCVQILIALGDPCAEQGTKRSMEIRIKKLMDARKVELVIFDEFQHMIDPDRDRVVHTTADWLKTQMNLLRRGYLLVGLPKFERVIRTSDQWRRRVESRFELRPFGWDSERDQAHFLKFLQVVEKMLPFEDTGGLLRQETLPKQLIMASNGYVAFVMRLILRASMVALAHGHTTLQTAHFRKAFRDLESYGIEAEQNPFSGMYRREPVERPVIRKRREAF